LWGFVVVKKILGIVALIALVLVLSDLANTVPTAPVEGTSFALKGQRVVACSDTEIVLVDSHQTATKLDKDGSWPDCSAFQANEVVDFFLSRGEKTHFISIERTAWWRKAM
jgi:hypothetical protein